MKRWALRWKMMLWTAFVVGFIDLCFGLGVAWHLYNEGLDELDKELRSTAHEFFQALGSSGANYRWDDPVAVQSLFPAARNLYFIEIDEPANRVVYRSKNLMRDAFPGPPGAQGFRTARLREKKVRLGVFERKGVVLRLAVSQHELEEQLSDIMRSFLVAAPVVLIAVGAAGWWLARKALQPVEEIAIAAERINAQRLDQRLPLPASRDEIAQLTIVLNKMFDRLEASFRQATRFTADASHELRTPLTVIRGELDAALREADLAPAHERLLLNLLEETNRLSSITDGLLLLSRADAGKLQLDFESVDFTDLMNGLLEDAEILAAPEDLRLDAEIPAGLRLVANEQFLRQLLLNLLDNAIKYNEPGGTVKVRAFAEAGTCRISIANTGPVMTPQQATHIFERFHRSENARDGRRSGHGLGLSICREIARAHGGEIAVDLSREGWTEFVVTLPRATVQQEPSKMTVL